MNLNISVPSLSESAVEALFASHQLVTVAATGVARQPELSLDLVPTLARGQAVAREHAFSWRASYHQALLQPLTDIQSYANTYDAYLPYLTKLAAQPDDAEALNQFRNGVRVLQGQASRLQGSLPNSKAFLGIFRQGVDDDDAGFASDAKHVEANYQGPQGDVARIRAALEEIDGRLAQSNQVIAEMTANAFRGALVSAIDFAVEIQNFATYKTVVQAGLTFARSAVAKDASALTRDAVAFFQEAGKVPYVFSGVQKRFGELIRPKALDEAQDAAEQARKDIARYGDEMRKLTSSQLQLGVFTTVHSNVKRMSGAAHQASSSLDDAYELWEEELWRLKHWDALAQGSSAAELPNHLNVAAAEWVVRADASRRYMALLTSVPAEIDQTT